MKLLLPVSINVALVVILYLLDKKTSFARLGYRKKQVIIGVLFGAFSCFASSYGVEVMGTVANIRDAAPLSAGLIFGAPAGIISGVIGGCYRWFSVYWGAGAYTQLACTLATILAGFMAAALRVFMFDNKKPTWSYAIAITILCEVVHMLLIFLTNMGDSVYAFAFVKGATFPMIVGNVVAVGVSLVLVSILSKEPIFQRKGSEHIAETFQRWLLACIVIAYLITSLFTFILQNGMVQIETQELFSSTISDVKSDIQGKSDAKMTQVVKDIRSQYQSYPDFPLHYFAVANGVVEINIVDKSGLITDSTQASLINSFNMNSTEQSREFMILTQESGSDTYVQKYGPVGSDGTTMRKMAGAKLSNGDFIQVGYDTEQFRKMLDSFAVDVTKNRHVGTNGFVAICDSDLNLITETALNGAPISTIGIIPNEEMISKTPAEALYRATINNSETGYSEEYLYTFSFVESYCIIAAMPVADAMFMRDASIYTSIFAQVMIFATLFVFIYVLIKKVIINNLRQINSTLAQITNGNLNVTVNVRSNEEFASLSDDINTTVSTLKRYIADAAARIDKELEYAKQIQHAALPISLPDNGDFGICADMIAAKEVGGDFYDFYQLDERTVAFLVADVSGKGIPAAMFMMTAKTIIKDLAESGLAVHEILTKANEKLCESNESGMFVTAWMGILDLRSGKLQYANAGHNPPLLKHSDGSFEYLRSRAGFVLAGMEGVRYRVNELNLVAGDRIFLYTDGVTEATNAENQLYGEDRLLAFMNQNAAEPAPEILPALKRDIDAFVGEAPQFDDITMVLFDYKFSKGGASMIDKTFPAKTDALGEVLGFVEETLESYDCPMKVQMAVSVAIEEVFVNVAHYAYGEGEGDVAFRIGFDEGSREVTIRMADRGVPFDPLKKPDPDITLSAEDRQIGGLGIFITKKTMDSVTYAYENGENVLTMIKKI